MSVIHYIIFMTIGFVEGIIITDWWHLRGNRSTRIEHEFLKDDSYKPNWLNEPVKTSTMRVTTAKPKKVKVKTA